MRYSLLYIIIFSAILVFNRCGIETYSTKIAEADDIISAYILDNNLNVKPEPSGLLMIPVVEGVGETPELGDKVAFHYKGYYLNGDVFDSSYDKSYPIIVELGKGQMISGIEEALIKMNKSSKYKVIVPFYLAYKDMEFAPVPPFSNLIFELELIDFIKSDVR